MSKYTTLKIRFSEQEQQALAKLAQRYRYDDVAQCIRNVALTEAAVSEVAEQFRGQVSDAVVSSSLRDELKKDDQ